MSWLDVSWHLCHFLNLAFSVLFGFCQNCAYLVTLGWRQGVGGLIATRRTVYSHTEQAMRLPIDKTGAGATNRRQRASFLTLNIHTSTTSTSTSTSASTITSISKLTVTSINLATAQLRAVNRSSVLILTGTDQKFTTLKFERSRGHRNSHYHRLKILQILIFSWTHLSI